MQGKSTLAEIQHRFDNDVERFSNLETGQQTTLDASFNMQLIAEGIAALYPAGAVVLDIGCGAGNYDVKLLEYIKPLDITLVDLSRPMLNKAKERVDAVNTGGTSRILQGDFRSVDLPRQSFRVIMARTRMHHVQNDDDCRQAFAKFYSILILGGSIWIFDMVEQATASLQELIYTERYGRYLTSLKDE